MSVPSRQVDEALDRLERDISFLESVIRSDEGYTETVIAQCIDAREDIATVRSELGRLRGEVVEWRTSIATEKLTWRAEAAEAEVERYREGLREAETAFSDISLILEAENEGYQERVYRRAVEEWRHARALLAASPDGANTEGGEA